MKRLLLAILPLLLSTSVFAQPDPNAPGKANNPPETPVVVQPSQDTPSNAVRYFVSAINDIWELRFTKSVAGAPLGYNGENFWETARLVLPAFLVGKDLKVDEVTVDSQTDDVAEVTVSVHSDSPSVVGTKPGEIQKYKLQLRLEEIVNPATKRGRKVWRVVPLPTETILAGSLFQLPRLPLIAALAERDPRLLPWLRQQYTVNRQFAIDQLKQLILTALQFLQDYGEIFSFDDVAYERALRPYTRNEIFTIIGTKDEKWRFNDNLSEKPSAVITDSSHTVLFYDGDAPQSDKLNFRFDGKTLIGFADGHVKSYTKDELQDLIWKP